jgi:hypothetical protein
LFVRYPQFEFAKERAMIELALRPVILSIPFVLLTTLPGATRASPASFDGAWSVVVVTDAGSCERSTRYGVRIIGGRVVYDGGSGVALSGQVNGAGRVVVSLRSSESAANGSGRLSGSAGAGRWVGVSGGSRCEGRWQAQRTE